MTIPTERDLELLSAYLDGALSGRERAALEQRLSHEQALREVLDDLRATVALVRGLPTLHAPRDFTLDPEVYGRPAPWWTRLFALESVLQLGGALGTAAAVLLIVVGLLAGGAADEDHSAAPGMVAQESAEVALSAQSSPTPIPAAAQPNVEQQTSVALLPRATLVPATTSTQIPATTTVAAQILMVPSQTPLPTPTLTVWGTFEYEEEALDDGNFAGAGAEGGVSTSIGEAPPAIADAPSSADEVFDSSEAEAPADTDIFEDAGVDAETGEAVREPETTTREYYEEDEQSASTTGNEETAPLYAAPPTLTVTATSVPMPTLAPTATVTAINIAPTANILFPGSESDGEEETAPQAPPEPQPEDEFMAKSTEDDDETGTTWLIGLGLALLAASLGAWGLGRRKARRA